MAKLEYDFPDSRYITDDRGYSYWNTWKWVEYESNKSGEYMPSSSLVVEMIEICKPLFNGSYTYTEDVVNPDGTITTVTKNYPAIDSNLDLVDYFLENYGDKILKFPACRCGYDEQKNLVLMSTGYGRAKKIMSNYTFSNKYKILTLLKSTDFKYNPIENYNMTETYAGDSRSESTTGSDSWLGKIDHNTSGSIDNNVTENEITTTQSTTFDNATFRDVDKVTRTIPNTTTSYNDYKVSDSQTEADKSHADSSSDYSDNENHTLKRSGNIGVTTTQQMLEQERNLAQINIVKDFFEGFQKEITLDIWY